MMGIVDFEHIMLDISAVALATSGPFLHRASQICVVFLPKKRRRPVSFRHEEKRFFLWTAPCLSIKSGVYRVTFAIFRLPSLIIL